MKFLKFSLILNNFSKREKNPDQEIMIEILLFIVLSLRKMKKLDNYKLVVIIFYFFIYF